MMQNSEAIQACPECGAIWKDGHTCQNDFYQFGYWELANPEVYGGAHHLMVLSFYLQHPSLYSPEGLAGAKQNLFEYLEQGLTPQEWRKRNGATLDSGKRKYRIKGTAASHGTYSQPIHWTMTAADVVAGGLDNYVDNIRRWAQSILADLRASGNIASTSGSGQQG